MEGLIKLPQATSLSIEPETSIITDPVTITLGLS